MNYFQLLTDVTPLKKITSTITAPLPGLPGRDGLLRLLQTVGILLELVAQQDAASTWALNQTSQSCC